MTRVPVTAHSDTRSFSPEPPAWRRCDLGGARK
jgi:hypothetical protein